METDEKCMSVLRIVAVVGIPPNRARFQIGTNGRGGGNGVVRENFSTLFTV